MEVLNVGGKEYVKASAIARELGYTADYVGQLCRGRKVNAKLVGRSWYVDRSSMDLHKTNRYRGTQTKSKEALKEEIKLQVNTPERSASSFYKHAQQRSAKVSYLKDDAELIPKVGEVKTKTGKLSIDLADATSVDIVSKSSAYVFDTPPLPAIRFKGSLPVSEISDKEYKIADDAVSDEVVDENTNKVALNIVKSAKTSESAKNDKKVEVVAEEVIEPITHVAYVEEDGAAAVEMNHLEVEEEKEGAPANKTMIMLSALTAVCVTLVLIGLEANITFTSQTLTTSYLFGIDNLTASSYTAFENLETTFQLLKFSTNLLFF